MATDTLGGTTADIVALNQLAYRYAAAVDACDVARLQSVFHPEGRLRSYHPGDDVPFADLTGRAQLAAVPDAMRGMYRTTAHMMMNHLVEFDASGGATGEVLCIARHLTLDETDPISVNVIIRYHDRYVRHDHEWLILDRQIRFQWSERHATADSGMGRREGRDQ
jgi:SnoaL-like domain